jgi:hypothetical protein
MTRSSYQYGSNLQYGVDVVFCIDVTGSMGPILEIVKRSALIFHRRLEDIMAEKNKAISQLRVKVIAFRDFGDRADDAILETEFFLFPVQLREFNEFMQTLNTGGGGDVPESGLEALALAMHSPWERGLDRRRHVIVVFSDAPAHPLGDPVQVKARTYPKSIPTSLGGLLEQWRSNSIMDNSAKRLLIFAPEEYPWSEIADDWNNTLFFPSEAGEGLEEFEFEEILNTIANSI